MHLFFAPPTRGWLLVRPATHAALFLGLDGGWVDTAGEARLFENRIQANRVAATIPDASVVHLSLVEWFKAPLIRAAAPALVSR